MKRLLLPAVCVLVWMLGTAPVRGAQPDFGRTWNDEVLYFILVDRFHDGDPTNNQGVDKADPLAFHGGDIQGVLQKLDYLQDLGVTAVWLSPINLNRPVPFYGQAAYHGYWIWDFFQIDPRFGTWADLRRLGDEMTKRKMKLLLDFVVNHMGYDAPFVQQFPGFFHQNGNIKDWNNPTECEQFRVFGLPDFASDKPAVRFHFANVARFWHDRVPIAGFRLDAVKHVSLGFWSWFNQRCRAAFGDHFFLLGEVMDGNPALLAKTKREGRFSSLFDFPLFYTLKDVIADGKDARQIGLRLYQDEKYDAPDQLATFLDNHDVDRFLTSCGNDERKLRAALAFLFAVRGIPTLTFGDETGMTGRHDPVPENRRDMDFEGRPALRDYVKTLIAARKRSPALRRGLQIHLLGTPVTYAFARLAEQQQAIFVMNTGATETLKLSLPLPVRANEGELWENVCRRGHFAKVVKGRLELSLDPWTAGIFLGTSPRKSEYLLQWQALAKLRKNPRLGPLTSVRLTARVPHVQPGETLHVIGGLPELGSWNPAEAPQMVRTETGDFRVTLKLPEHAIFEFKCLKRLKDQVIWYDGPNQLIDLAAIVPVGAPASLTFDWPAEKKP